MNVTAAYVERAQRFGVSEGMLPKTHVEARALLLFYCANNFLHAVCEHLRDPHPQNHVEMNTYVYFRHPDVEDAYATLYRVSLVVRYEVLEATPTLTALESLRGDVLRISQYVDDELARPRPRP